MKPEDTRYDEIMREPATAPDHEQAERRSPADHRMAAAVAERLLTQVERGGAIGIVCRAYLDLAAQLAEVQKLYDDLHVTPTAEKRLRENIRLKAQLAERERALKQVTNQRDQWKAAYEARLAYYKRDIAAATRSDSEERG